MYNLLIDAAKEKGNKIGLNCDGEKITYNECKNKMLSIANALSEFGISAGDKVGLIMDSPLDFVYSLMAISYCGATVIPIYLRQGKERVKQLLEYFEITYVLAMDAECLFEELTSYEMKLLSTVPYQLYINEDYVTDSSLVDIALIMFSSGTTSVPKAVMLSKENVMSNIMAISDYLNLVSSDKILMIKNLNHASSIIGELLVGLYSQCMVFMTRKLIKTNTLFRLIRDNQITVFFAIPYILENILDYKKCEQFDISSLKKVNFYGGKLSGEKIRMLCNKFPTIDFIYSYGLTEASPRVTYIKREDLVNHFCSCGKEINGVHVSIRDQEGNEVGPGIEGEITIEGPNVMQGYYKNLELSQIAIRDGILYTKDIGYKDIEGFLYVTGRKDNMFIIAGKNIHPEEIEGLFNQNDGVKESLVIFKEESNSIEAYVLMNNGYHFNELELNQLCRDNLEFYKLPKKIYQVRDFSRTVSGKIIRKQELSKYIME